MIVGGSGKSTIIGLLGMLQIQGALRFSKIFAYHYQNDGTIRQVEAYTLMEQTFVN